MIWFLFLFSFFFLSRSFTPFVIAFGSQWHLYLFFVLLLHRISFLFNGILIWWCPNVTIQYCIHIVTNDQRPTTNTISYRSEVIECECDFRLKFFLIFFFFLSFSMFFFALNFLVFFFPFVMIHAMDAMRSFTLVQLKEEKYIYWTYIFRINKHEIVFSHETKCFIVLNANESCTDRKCYS